MPLYGLIGYPLEHSFSVNYFARKFRDEGIEAEYRNFPMPDLSGFRELVESESALVGLNVTVPFKEEIIPYLDGLNQTARKVGAVNTICLCRKEGRLALAGHNTDVLGFERSLKENLKEQHRSALVLGTGGSSKAVTYVLDRLGITCQLVSRKGGANRITYDELEHEHVNRHKLIINTTPMGMYPDTESAPRIPYRAITREHLLFDLIYNPEKTRFLQRGEQQGASIVNGYDMLVYQAEGSWEIWNRMDRNTEDDGEE